FSPSASRSASTCSGVALVPAISCATSPGKTRSVRKMTTLDTRSPAISRAPRVRAYRIIRCSVGGDRHAGQIDARVDRALREAGDALAQRRDGRADVDPVDGAVLGDDAGRLGEQLGGGVGVELGARLGVQPLHLGVVVAEVVVGV